MPNQGTVARNNQDLLDMYDDGVPAYHSWRDHVLDQTQYYGYDGAVSAKQSPINDLLELTQYYDYKGPTVQNLNGTFVAGNPNATFNAGNLNSTFVAGNPNATFNAGNLNSTFIAGNPNATFNAGNPNATLNAGNLNSTFIAGNPNATFAVNNLNATFNAMSNKEDELASARENLLDNMEKQESLLQDVDDQLQLLKTEKKIVKRQAKDAMYTMMGAVTASKQVSRRNYPQDLAEQFLRDKDYRRSLSFSNLEDTLVDADETLEAVDEALEDADDTLEAVDEVLLAGSMLHHPNTSLSWRPTGVLVGPNDSQLYRSSMSLNADDASFYSLGPDDTLPYDQSAFITSQGPYNESAFIVSQGPYDFPRRRPWYRAPRRYLSAIGRNIPRALRSNRVAPYDG